MGRFTVHVRPFVFNFTQVKVKKVGMPHRKKFTSSKKISSIKNAIVVINQLFKVGLPPSKKTISVSLKALYK